MGQATTPDGGIDSPFNIDLSKPRWSQDTYLGRLRHFTSITNPLNLLTSPSAQAHYKSLVKDHIAGKIDPKLTATDYWHAKNITDATYHSDTGEKVFLPFRMAAFVPVNIPLIVGLLTPNPSIATIIGWQWVNQSVNVAYNWANANKSIEMSTQETIAAYAGAVITSCTAAVGLTQAADRGYIPRGVRPFIPFVSVASAGVANVFLMRQKELKEGIQLQTSEGEFVGQSPKAGIKAVGSVAVSRVVASVPSLTIPPVIMGILDRRGVFNARPQLRAPVNVSLISLALLVGLPSAIALFPQQASIDVDKLEPRFAKIPDRKNGGYVQTLYFNKGL